MPSPPLSPLSTATPLAPLTTTLTPSTYLAPRSSSPTPSLRTLQEPSPMSRTHSCDPSPPPTTTALSALIASSTSTLAAPASIPHHSFPWTHIDSPPSRYSCSTIFIPWSTRLSDSLQPAIKTQDSVKADEILITAFEELEGLLVLTIPEGVEERVRGELVELHGVIRGRVREMAEVLKGKRKGGADGGRRGRWLDRLKEELVEWVEEFDEVMGEAERGLEENERGRR